MANAINDVGSPRLERARHTRKYRDLFNCDMGQLIPIQADLCIPGDVLRVNYDFVTRMQPLVAPILQEINLDCHTFFVPIRIVDEDFADDENGTISGGVFRPGDPDKGNDGLSTKTFPRWIPHTNPPQKYSLWDYFGHPLTNIAAPFPTDWHRRCYLKIYNDYYRGEQFEKELDINDLNNENILYRAFRKDYFTSAAPHTVEGIPPSLPITGETKADFSDAPLDAFIANTIGLQNRSPQSGRFVRPYNPTGNPNLEWGRGELGYLAGVLDGAGVYRGIAYANYDPLNATGTPHQQDVITASSSIGVSDAAGWIRTGIRTNQDYINWLNNNTVDLSTAATFDVNDLRDIVQMHKFMERNARIGLRYTEQLQGRWRVSPRDERLQRPEYIGGSRTPIIISEVLQTSQTTQGTNGSPQGNLAGHGLTASTSRTRKYFVKEWGYLITIISIMPKVGYSQGIDRQYLYESRYDFPAPEFMHLGEREVLQTEIYTQGNETANRTIFGYRPMFDEMRLAQDRVCGDMRDTFNYWHLNREFDNAPLLNANFISTKNNIRKDIFAVQNEPGFIIHAGITTKMIRSLPKLGEPGLMDHF